MKVVLKKYSSFRLSKDVSFESPHITRTTKWQSNKEKTAAREEKWTYFCNVQHEKQEYKSDNNVQLGALMSVKAARRPRNFFLLHFPTFCNCPWAESSTKNSRIKEENRSLSNWVPLCIYNKCPEEIQSTAAAFTTKLYNLYYTRPSERSIDAGWISRRWKWNTCETRLKIIKFSRKNIKKNNACELFDVQRKRI